MKRGHRLLFLPLLLLLLSCCDHKPERHRPPELIEESKMVEMLTDQLLIEAVIFEMPVDSNKQVFTRQYYAGWFKKYNVTQKQFEESLDYYFNDDKDVERIMTQVQKNLVQKKSALKQ